MKESCFMLGWQHMDLDVGIMGMGKFSTSRTQTSCSCILTNLLPLLDAAHLDTLKNCPAPSVTSSKTIHDHDLQQSSRTAEAASETHSTHIPSRKILMMSFLASGRVRLTMLLYLYIHTSRAGLGICVVQGIWHPGFQQLQGIHSTWSTGTKVDRHSEKLASQTVRQGAQGTARQSCVLAEEGLIGAIMLGGQDLAHGLSSAIPSLLFSTGKH